MREGCRGGGWRSLERGSDWCGIINTAAAAVYVRRRCCRPETVGRGRRDHFEQAYKIMNDVYRWTTYFVAT